MLWLRRVLSRWDPPIPLNPAGEGSSKFPTRGGGGGAKVAPWEAEPGGVARAPYKSAIGTWRGPLGGGRRPCDVAGVAEFGCAVPGCPVPGAGKLPFAPLPRVSIPRAWTLKFADRPARALLRRSRRAFWRGQVCTPGVPKLVLVRHWASCCLVRQTKAQMPSFYS